MVFVVPSVDEDFVRVHQKAGKQYDRHLGRKDASVNKVSIKYIRIVNCWKTVLEVKFTRVRI